MLNRVILPLLWALLFIVLGYVAFQFSYLDQLTSFADDGGSYLIMAQHFSPYSVASPLVEKAYESEYYPPLFPMLLALTGGAERIATAHLFIITTFVFGSALYALWATRMLQSQWFGMLACLAYVSSPSVWPMLLRIVSEELYTSLTFGVLLVAKKAKTDGGIWLVVVTLLLTAVVLTRITGVSLIIAWGIYLLVYSNTEKRPVWAGVLSLAMPVMAVIAWHITRQSGMGDLYGSELEVMLNRFSINPELNIQLAEYLSFQLGAFIDSWLGALMLAWQPGFNTRTLVSILLAVLVTGGWFLRVRKNCLDAWYTLFYVCMIIVWPFPGQFYRFILPILPLFIVYAIQFAQTVANRYQIRMARVAPLLTGLSFLSLSIPAVGIIYQRAQYPSDHGLNLSSNPEFYQEADFDLARNKAIQHLLVMQDMRQLKEYTAKDDKIMWFTPNYLNLIAEREGMAFPNVAGREAMLSAIEQNPPDFVYISSLHPRRTTDNGLAMLAWAGEAGPLEWKRHLPGSNKVFSVLLHIKDRDVLK